MPGRQVWCGVQNGWPLLLCWLVFMSIASPRERAVPAGLRQLQVHASCSPTLLTRCNESCHVEPRVDLSRDKIIVVVQRRSRRRRKGWRRKGRLSRGRFEPLLPRRGRFCVRWPALLRGHKVPVFGACHSRRWLLPRGLGV